MGSSSMWCKRIGGRQPHARLTRETVRRVAARMTETSETSLFKLLSYCSSEAECREGCRKDPAWIRKGSSAR